MSYGLIQRRLLKDSGIRVPKKTIAYWLRHDPLSVAEKRAAHAISCGKPPGASKKIRGATSKFAEAVSETMFTRERKAQIAEAAVLLRLVIHGFETFTPFSDHSKADWIVCANGRRLTLQVKWVRDASHGLPIIPLVCNDYEASNRQRRYAPGEFDFIVGYDYQTDTAYVFSETETRNHKASISIREDAAERWDKLMQE